MEATHTPGPWEQCVLLVQDATGNQIAHCTRWELGRPMPEVAEANARLIAAAPDLLAALKAVTNDMDMAGGDGYGMSECPWCGKDDFNADHRSDCELLSARAVIAKAEGR